VVKGHYWDGKRVFNCEKGGSWSGCEKRGKRTGEETSFREWVYPSSQYIEKTTTSIIRKRGGNSESPRSTSIWRGERTFQKRVAYRVVILTSSPQRKRGDKFAPIRKKEKNPPPPHPKTNQKPKKKKNHGGCPPKKTKKKKRKKKPPPPPQKKKSVLSSKMFPTKEESPSRREKGGT